LLANVAHLQVAPFCLLTLLATRALKPLERSDAAVEDRE